MLQYKRGDLFTAIGDNLVFVHACNCRGSWGAGIAVQFKQRFPLAYQNYNQLCNKYNRRLLGMGIYHKQMDSTEPPVACLFTSVDYGKYKDPTDKIISNTKRSIACLLSVLPKDAHVVSPKINAGLFAVPWKDTEKILIQCLKQRVDVTWTVYEL